MKQLLRPNLLQRLARVQSRSSTTPYRHPWQRLHLDGVLLLGLGILLSFGLLILYSSANQNSTIIHKQLIRAGIAGLLMVALAQIPSNRLKSWSTWLYSISLLLLTAVLLVGTRGKGAQRWLNLGFMQFQPAELMKIALPMMLAWYFSERPLPPTPRDLVCCAVLLLLPTLLIAKQPDLGTALMIAASGATVLFLAGLNGRLIIGLVVLTVLTAPLVWHGMHPYQRDRVLIFLNPESDPLGSGYHIIQSKIALGSGGLYGKGWLHGTQSHLNFLPEHATDFIFAVCGEELGLLGSLALLLVYLLVVSRSLYIALQAQDTYCRLLAGCLSINFFFAFFVNMGMVTGLLPVVGLPLPLVSYGGTSMVTLLASFGILMSIHTHRTLVKS